MINIYKLDPEDKWIKERKTETSSIENLACDTVYHCLCKDFGGMSNTLEEDAVETLWNNGRCQSSYDKLILNIDDETVAFDYIYVTTSGAIVIVAQRYDGDSDDLYECNDLSSLNQDLLETVYYKMEY